jgi:hypothetical protein
MSRFFQLMTTSALLIAIAGIILACIWNTNQNRGIQEQFNRLANTKENATHASMQNAMLQSQMVEIMMQSSSEQILQEGTFIWTIGDGNSNRVGSSCSTQLVPSFTSYSIATAGTGYFVGDLVTLFYQDAVPVTVTYSANAVLKITAVHNTTGAVLSFDVMTPGCVASGGGLVPGNPIATTCVRGVGLTINRAAMGFPAYNATDYYGAFPPLAPFPQAPLQYSNYSLREVTIQSVSYTVLYLSPPPFPMVIGSFSQPSPIVHLNVAMANYEPTIPELQGFGSEYYVFPLTNKNYDAINVTDNVNCYLNNIQCFMDADQGSTLQYARSMLILNSNSGSIFYPVIQFYLKSGFDWAANDAVFTLNYPLVVVLKSY